MSEQLVPWFPTELHKIVSTLLGVHVATTSAGLVDAVGTSQLLFQTLKARRKSIHILVGTNTYTAPREPDDTSNCER